MSLVRDFEARALVLAAVIISLPWTAAELFYGGNFTAAGPEGGKGLNFGGGTNGDVNSIDCMEKSKWRYCLVGGNFTSVGNKEKQNTLHTGGGLAMYDRDTLRWSLLGGHTWSSAAIVYAIKTTPIYDRVTFKHRTVTFVGGHFTERVNPTVNQTGSGTLLYNFMIHNGNEWEETSFNYGFDGDVYGMELHKTRTNCEETVQACGADIYVVGKFSTTADYAVPTRRVAVGRYSDREYISNGISTFVVKYTWSYLASNDVPSYAQTIVHCGAYLFVGGVFTGGIRYTEEFNINSTWNRVSTGLSGSVNSLACVSNVQYSSNGSVIKTFGTLHVGGDFIEDDGLIVTSQRYHVTTATDTQMDWIQVGRVPSKTEYSCVKCTGEELELGYPVTTVLPDLGAADQYYTVSVASRNRIYQYNMGSHPHEIRPSKIIIQADVDPANKTLFPYNDGVGVIRTLFMSAANPCVSISGWSVVLPLGLLTLLHLGAQH